MGSNLIGKFAAPKSGVIHNTADLLRGGIYYHYDYGTSPVQTMPDRWYESTKTVGWKTIRRNGSSLPKHYFLGGAVMVTDSVGSWRDLSNPGDIYIGSHQAYSPAAVNALHSQRSRGRGPFYDAALSNCLANMSNMKVNLAQAYAERKQTADLLIKSVNRFIAFAIAFRKGSLTEANRILRSRGHKPLDFTFNGTRNPRNEFKRFRRMTHNDFANMWLEYSYGWRPLLSDVHGAAELLSNVHMKNRPTISVGFATDIFKIDNSFSAAGELARCTGGGKVEYKCVFGYSVDDSLLDQAKSTGLTNPALLAWELLPYSFVLDWFIPVGKFLKNMEATRGLSFRFGYMCERMFYEETSIPQGFPGMRYSYSGNGIKSELGIFRRTIFSSFPSMPPLPTFSVNLGASQITSGLSLLSQLFSRK